MGYLKIFLNFFRFIFLKIRFGSRLKCSFVQSVSFGTKFRIGKGSSVTIGRNLVTDGRCVIDASGGGRIVIGDGVYLNDGAVLSAKDYVEIGSGTLFGPNVKVYDNNHIFTSQGVTFKYKCAPIKVGEKCWLASNAVILKGVSVGNCSVISAGVVLRQSVPEKSLITQKSEVLVKPIL